MAVLAVLSALAPEQAVNNLLICLSTGLGLVGRHLTPTPTLTLTLTLTPTLTTLPLPLPLPLPQPQP